MAAPKYRGRSVTVMDRVSLPSSHFTTIPHGGENYVIGSLPDGSIQRFKIEDLYTTSTTDSVAGGTLIVTVTDTLTPRT